MPNHFGPEWTTSEIAILTTMRRRGCTIREIAQVITNRSHRSIESKAKHLKLPSLYKPTPPINPPARRPRPDHNAIPRAGKTTLPPLPSLQLADE